MFHSNDNISFIFNINYCIRGKEKKIKIKKILPNDLSSVQLSQSLNTQPTRNTHAQQCSLQKPGVKPADPTRMFPLDHLTNDKILKDLVESLDPHWLCCPRILLHWQRRQREFVDRRLWGMLVCLFFVWMDTLATWFPQHSKSHLVLCGQILVPYNEDGKWHLLFSFFHPDPGLRMSESLFGCLTLPIYMPGKLICWH